MVGDLGVSRFEKAYLVREHNGDNKKDIKLACMFNPNELTISKAVTWKAPDNSQKGGDAPNLTFEGGQSATLSMTVMFDTTDTGEPVTDATNEILALMAVDKTTAKSGATDTSARPPTVVFKWGKASSMAMVLTSATIKFTYFGSDGTPLRASADLKLTQLKDESVAPLQNPTSHTPFPHRVHHVTRGETLDRIAHRYYDDSARWREIADANAITNPLAVAPGTALVIPKGRVMSRG